MANEFIKQTAYDRDEDIIYLDVKCVFCGKPHFIMVYGDDFTAWQNGKHAQDAFPYLSVNDREMLISGCCSQCWDKMFGGEN